MMNEIRINYKFKPLFKQPKNVRYYIVVGGRGCFEGNQDVLTINGYSKIKDVSVGDLVLSYNEQTKQNEYKEVRKTFKYDNNKLISIKLKNGTTIKVTEDHKFYHNGCWVMIKDLLFLWYGNMEENREV